jgi:hypothetical protein
MKKGLIGFAGILFLFDAVSVASLTVGILVAGCLTSLIVYLRQFFGNYSVIKRKEV